MVKRDETVQKIKIETNDLVKQIAAELTVIQRDRVTIPEVFRRTFNIPNVVEELKKDAEQKRRLK